MIKMRLFPNAKRVRSKLKEEFKNKTILELGYPYNSRNSQLQKTQDCQFKLDHNLNHYPWPIPDDHYDLVLCQHLIEYLSDIPKAMEELNRITKPGGKIYLETPHYTWFEAYRHIEQHHHFSFGSFDYFLKGNPYYKTDFEISEKYLFFDDLTYLLGVGFLANFFPRFYEKRLAFIFPATSFYVTFQVVKSIQTI